MLYDADGVPIEPARLALVGPALGPVRLPAPADLPAWQANVTRLWGGPNQHVSWLHLDWYDDEGVNRLVLWQVVPIEQCGPFQRDILLGPPPGKDRYGRQTGTPMVRIQWDLCQRLHGWASPYWIVQGERGGHKRRFDHVEQQTLRMAGLPTEPPVPGALSYAPFDQRVIDQVMARDRMLKYKHCLDFAERRPEQIDAEDRATLEMMRAEHLKWLERQVDIVFDGLSRKDLQDITTSRDVAPIDADRQAHDFITEE